MSYITQLECVSCGESVPPTPSHWMTCQRCGVNDGIQDIHFDLDRVRAAWQAAPLQDRPLDHWRYRELLPIDPQRIPENWRVGWTPLISVPALAQRIGLQALWLKDEGRNPTASFKDRASSVGVVHARQMGAETIACASTGNAASSLAGHAALAGMAAVIFVPATAPQPKLAQLLVFNAKVVSVNGSYDEAYRLCSAACEKFGWYNRNCAMNPVLVEGKKTGGLELAEQCSMLGTVPDWVAVSVGDGCTIAGVWKGLQQMHALGILDRLPRMLGVQAEGMAPIAAAVATGNLPSGVQGSTIADSIDVPVPRNWRKAIYAITASNGRMQTVSDEAILSAMRDTGEHGVFAEPAAAAAVAGVSAARTAGVVREAESVVAMITGSGLKDTASALKAGGEPLRISPDLCALEHALGL